MHAPSHFPIPPLWNHCKLSCNWKIIALDDDRQWCPRVFCRPFMHFISIQSKALRYYLLTSGSVACNRSCKPRDCSWAVATIVSYLYLSKSSIRLSGLFHQPLLLSHPWLIPVVAYFASVAATSRLHHFQRPIDPGRFVVDLPEWWLFWLSHWYRTSPWPVPASRSEQHRVRHICLLFSLPLWSYHSIYGVIRVDQ